MQEHSKENNEPRYETVNTPIVSQSPEKIQAILVSIRAYIQSLPGRYSQYCDDMEARAQEKGFGKTKVPSKREVALFKENGMEEYIKNIGTKSSSAKQE